MAAISSRSGRAKAAHFSRVVIIPNVNLPFGIVPYPKLAQRARRHFWLKKSASRKAEAYNAATKIAATAKQGDDSWWFPFSSVQAIDHRRHFFTYSRLARSRAKVPAYSAQEIHARCLVELLILMLRVNS